jgi:predicted AlkP superfamily pyrophosphatase or phosphodiesterase
MPNTARLAGEGGLMNLTVDGHATETTPWHVEMLTGYPPNVTGAYSNLEYSVIPANLTIFERLESRFGADNITTVMLTGKPLIIEYITDPSQLEVINWTMNSSHPFYNARSSVDCLDLNLANASVVGGKALQYLEEYKDKRAFMFIHFRDPDQAGHNYGENSADYDAAIVECDQWLGALILALESEGSYNRTIVYVTTYHGFDEGSYGHSYAADIWLFTNDP